MSEDIAGKFMGIINVESKSLFYSGKRSDNAGRKLKIAGTLYSNHIYERK